MNTIPPAGSTFSAATDLLADTGQPLFTLFAAPKAFEGHTGIIQRNAIGSWCALMPSAEIFLFGDDQGIGEVAEEFSLRHFPNISRNEAGTPLLDQIFQQAIDAASAPLMIYTNSDIIFDSSLVKAITCLLKLGLDSFLAIGQRIDIEQTALLDFKNPSWEREFGIKMDEQGELASILCKDYFIFPSDTYRDIPPFSIGRGNWDNWMVSRATQNKAPVIDMTDVLRAVHQNHNYDHAGGRLKAYVTGAEAKKNKQLAGGTHYVTGSVATHRLKSEGDLKPNSRIPMFTFLKDLPRIMSLLWQLVRR